MKTTNATDAAWAALETEKRRDRMLRVVGFGAWTIALAALLFFAVMVVSNVVRVRQAVLVGIAADGSALKAALPLVAVVGTLAVLIATLATIGMFLRMRTASLTEIQLRLAALETLLTRDDEG